MVDIAELDMLVLVVGIEIADRRHDLAGQRLIEPPLSWVKDWPDELRAPVDHRTRRVVA